MESWPPNKRKLILQVTATINEDMADIYEKEGKLIRNGNFGENDLTTSLSGLRGRRQERISNVCFSLSDRSKERRMSSFRAGQ